MKDFFKHVLATIVGLLLFTGITIAFGFLAIVGLLMEIPLQPASAIILYWLFS